MVKCPVCHIDMIVVEYNKIELDYCTRCTGVWFDSGELELLLKKEGVAMSPPGTMFSPARSDEKKRRCPICTRRMNKVQVGETGVLIDACPRGEGFWFDGGEIDRLIAGVGGRVREAIAPFLSDVFQARQKK